MIFEKTQLSFVIFSEALSAVFGMALVLLLMLIGTYFLVFEKHAHNHAHISVTHEHRHSHDDGHKPQSRRAMLTL
jgi:hypothetical protein